MSKAIKTGPIMAALLIAGFVGLFSETALNIALSHLSETFEVGNTTIQWLATGYFLTLGIMIPITGILMQKFSTRQMFIASIVLLIVGTVLAAAAPEFGMLLAGRIIQAAGLAINLPLTQNVIFTIFPPEKRGGAMGAMGLVMLAGPALGPTIAGLILDTLAWNWIFWVMIPFLLFSLFAGWAYLPNLNERQPVKIDPLSVILSTIGFGGIVYGFSVGGEDRWGSAIVISSIIIGAIGILLFVIRQLKMTRPMLNLVPFKFPMFILGVIMSFITFYNMMSMLVILPMYMQVALLVASFTAGLALLPGSLLNCILAPVMGRLFDRFGPRAVIAPGAALVAIAYFIYSRFGADSELWMVVATHIVMMLGVGLVLAATQTNTLNSLPRQCYPDGIALTQTVQQVAGAIGVVVMMTIMSSKQSSYMETVAPEIAKATASGTSLVFTIGMVLAIVNFVLALFLKKPVHKDLRS